MPLPNKSLSTDEFVDDESLSESDVYEDNDYEQGEEPEKHEIAGEETKTIERSKLLVYLALTVAGLAVGLTTFFLFRRSETNTFNNEFYDYADELILSAESNVFSQVDAIQDIGTACTSFGLATRAQWPNFTLPDFNRRFSSGSQDFDVNQRIALHPIVATSQIEAFEAYASSQMGWIEDSIAFEQERGANLSQTNWESIMSTPPKVFSPPGNTEAALHDIVVPSWQIAPLLNGDSYFMQDLYPIPWYQDLVDRILRNQRAVVSGLLNLGEGSATDSVLLTPVFEDFPDTSASSPSIVAFISASLSWGLYLEDVLPSGLPSVFVQVDDNCGQVSSYQVTGPDVKRLEEEEASKTIEHNGIHQNATFASSLTFVSEDGNRTSSSSCYFTIDIYPSTELKESYRSYQPYVFAAGITFVFLMTMAIFAMYDYRVRERQELIVGVAQRSADIVTNLFPKNVHERMLAEAENRAEEQDLQAKPFLNDGNPNKPSMNKSSASPGMAGAPIADFFPDTTVMFADLVGFTAWSSTQQPTQVFTLLETIYYEFDQLAKKRGVFKVETIGDCYVAATGLPEARDDHAVAMVRFARDCREKFLLTIVDLQDILGPDTSDLGLRIGLHSGPVTAGVLRGEKARFQLFGDTMNTTARIESTGKKNMIHLSEETANLIKAADKEHWLELREDRVQAKGKGELTTYWLIQEDGKRGTNSSATSDTAQTPDGAHNVEADENAMLAQAVPSMKKDAKGRFIKWNTEVLTRFLKSIIAHRQASKARGDPQAIIEAIEQEFVTGSNVLDEVEDCINLPSSLDSSAADELKTSAPANLEPEVQKQLEKYVHAIADMYHGNSFHSLEHASHVVMSVNKLLSRIVAPSKIATATAQGKARELKRQKFMKVVPTQNLHDHTYGITSDPLTQFAVVFSALIHDVDHQGVPNTQLIKEKKHLAACYKNKSVAEQNSVVIAWGLLMDESFTELRKAIYSTEVECRRFRALVVNSVMATDIMDQELGAARKARWQLAFGESAIASEATPGCNDPATNRKATIVIEHLIQASDVAHTMQHWQIYQKWNARLFQELSDAYMAGRSETDPADGWYKGELGFFDFYVIPLAKKLKDCGVFGVSSDEYLNYAIKNRQEWAMKGQGIVATMVANRTEEKV